MKSGWARIGGALAHAVAFALVAGVAGARAETPVPRMIVALFETPKRCCATAGQDGVLRFTLPVAGEEGVEITVRREGTAQ